MKGLIIGRSILTGPKTKPGVIRMSSKEKMDIFRNITLYVSLPLIGLAGLYTLWKRRGEKKRPEFVPYDYLRIRKTPFPWGDGNKTLFHNKHRNALPDGYET